jgi:hypothetical protein
MYIYIYIHIYIYIYMNQGDNTGIVMNDAATYTHTQLLK